jgi:hypothetical protein
MHANYSPEISYKAQEEQNTKYKKGSLYNNNKCSYSRLQINYILFYYLFACLLNNPKGSYKINMNKDETSTHTNKDKRQNNVT